MLFFRIFQHLLPTGKAWRVVVDKALRRFFIGLAAPLVDLGLDRPHLLVGDDQEVA